MSPRVLVCIEDTAVSLVISARLVSLGAEGVVVDAPANLIEEARKGLAVLVVQDRYRSGELGSSLLRQVRVARGAIVAGVVLVVDELAAADRHVLEKQYKIQSFLPIGANPFDIADAIRRTGNLIGVDGGAAPVIDEEGDLILHEDEVKNEFDISIESRPDHLQATFTGSFEADDALTGQKTAELSKADLLRLKKTVNASGSWSTPATAADAVPTASLTSMPPRQVHTEVTKVFAPIVSALRIQNVDSGEEATHLPAPGGDNDFELSPKLPALTQGPSLGSSVEPVLVPVLKPESSIVAISPSIDPPSAANGSDEEDPMQIQELQRTQAQLKSALLAEKRSREIAQKRVDELEARLTRMGEAATSTGQGVPAAGVFEELRYPALLARARSEAFTGAVLMATGGSTRTVFLKDGLPVAFSSSEPGQRIGKVLVAQGRITDEQYMKAATRMVERSIKLTDALVELGLIDAESLAIEQRNLTRDQIIQGFEVVQGRFTTTAGASPDTNTPTFDFGPGEIYVQGYRRYAPPSEMLAGFETLREKYLIANSRLAVHRNKLGLSSEDERLIRLLGDALTVEEAVERAELKPEHCARLLSALQALDLVEEWSPGVEQFRNRIRAERQRQVEEIASNNREHQRREERLLEAFERALSGRADASSLRASLSSPSTAPAVAERPAEKREEKQEDKKSPITTGGFRSETPRAPGPSLASSLSSTLSSAMPSSSSSLSSSSLSSLPSLSSLSSLSSVMPLSPTPASPPPSMPIPSTPSLSLSSQAQSALSPSQSSSSSEQFFTAISDSAEKDILGKREKISVQAAVNPPANYAATADPMSPAAKKYKEGIEQATNKQLDEAEITLREAVRLDATRPEYLTSLARVLLDNPRYERVGTLPVVRSLLDRAVQIAPGHSGAVDLHKQVVAEMGR